MVRRVLFRAVMERARPVLADAARRVIGARREPMVELRRRARAVERCGARVLRVPLILRRLRLEMALFLAVTLTPERRAFERPMARARFFAPCLRRLTWRIPPRTIFPA